MSESWLYGLGVLVVLVVGALVFRRWKARKTDISSEDIYPLF
jgi:hypothetical protein